MQPIEVREYGAAGPAVFLLHGGPGAPGSVAPLARMLAPSFRVYEPLQRRSGTVPLGVAQHIADLRDALHGAPARPALVGASWGAMLALAFAAAHPETAGPLVLIGCGTFDLAARTRLNVTLAERMTPELSHRLTDLEQEIGDADERLRAMGALIQPLYDFDPERAEATALELDGRGHRESWVDMLRLQREGVYPAAFSTIQSPVLMLHGAWDPHPGRLIHAGLRRHLPWIEYREWEACGHEPWRERAVAGEFLAVLSAWLRQAEA